MTTIAQQLGQLEQDIYALAKRPSSEVLLAIDSRLSAIRAAVGGEAVAWITDESLRGLARGGNGSRGTVPVHKERSNVAKYPLYASPPATVDAVALRELISEMQALADRNTGLGMPVFSSAYVVSRLAALIGEKA